MYNCYPSPPCDCSPPNLGPSLGPTCGLASAVVTFMTLLDVYIRRQCDLADPCGRVRPRSVPDDSYDFIVIGGGVGGPVVAGRLVENSQWNVLLLEAGGEEPAGAAVPAFAANFFGNPLTDWNYKTEPQENACLAEPERRCSWPRGKALGGTAIMHGMMYMRGSPKDYSRWVQMGNSGWDWDKVLSYYRRLEDKKQVGYNNTNYKYHGGPMTVDLFPEQPALCFDLLQAAKDQGFNISDDLNDSDQHTGFVIAQATHRNGVRLTTATAYLRPQRENLHVMLNSTATKILINNSTKRAYAVEFVYNNKTYIVNATKEIIVAGGAINSPQLLLLSGVGPRKDLEKLGIPVVYDLPGVGKNLRNHVGTSLTFSLTKLPAINHLNWGTAMQYLFDRNGPLSSTAMAQFTAILNSKYADPAGDDPDLQFFFGGFWASCGSGAVCDNDSTENETLNIRPINLHPRSHGYLKLASRNPFEAPIMQPNYLSDETDIKPLVDGIRIAFHLVNATNFTEKYGPELIREEYAFEQCGQHPYDSDEFWSCYVRYITAPENHQVGTCMMGPRSNKLAVVDSKLAVHGIKGLRVVDASVMPTPISGNIQSAIFMIGERAADFIKEFWLGTWINMKAPL